MRIIGGLFVLFGLAFIFTPMNSNAQTAKAVITVEESFVYEKPDFDSQIIGTAEKGKVYSISKGKRGPFHKIRIKPGFVGWISEIDLKISGAGGKSTGARPKKSTASAKASANKKSEKKSISEDSDSGQSRIRRKKPVNQTRYWGPALQYMNFTENTMGKKRTEPLLMYGVKLSGPGSLFLGGTSTDANLLFYWGAPGYYSTGTGRPADGWMILTDFLYLVEFPQSRQLMSFVGFGPMFRYSHFNVTLPQAGSNTPLTYSLDDMVLGAAFNGGIAYQAGPYALRLDGKYYWEKQQYFAGGVSFQFEF